MFLASAATNHTFVHPACVRRASALSPNGRPCQLPCRRAPCHRPARTQRQAHTELRKLRRGGHGVRRCDDQRRPCVPALLARPHHAAQAAARGRHGRAGRRAAARGRGQECGGALAQRAPKRICQACGAIRVETCLPCCQWPHVPGAKACSNTHLLLCPNQKELARGRGWLLYRAIMPTLRAAISSLHAG